MSFGSSLSIGRPRPTQTTSAVRTSTPKVLYPPTGQMTSQRCCDTGRPVMIDPVTGGTVCSCQLKSGLPAYLSRVPSLPETMYSATCGQFQPSSGLGPESLTAFYQLGMKQGSAADGLKLAPSGVHAPYYLEHLMATHPYNAFYPGLDLNSARRKNATRETTSALKAWLYEHRKNPYPTKGEKIMLAIITRMTLTQVSTWFANARRRLKKETKLDDKDGDMVDLDDIDVDDSSEKNTVSRLSESTDGGHTSVDLSDISDAEDSPPRLASNDTCFQRLFSPEPVLKTAEKVSVSNEKNKSSSATNTLTQNSCAFKSNPSSSSKPIALKESAGTNKCAQGQINHVKPKIWSISEIISTKQDA